MSSSRWYEFILIKDGHLVRKARRDALELPWHPRETLPVRASETLGMTIRRPPEGAAPLRLRLGNEVVAAAPPGCSEFRMPDQAWFWNEIGESVLTVEEEAESESGDGEVTYSPVCEVLLEVVPRPEVDRDFRVMLEDIATVHEALARDLIGRAFLRRGLGTTEATRLPPRVILERLRELHAELEHALGQIAGQPSVLLARTTRPGRYRGGDRLDTAAVVSAVRDPATRIGPGGRVLALGRVTTRVPVLSEDLPEHRHMAEALRRLARQADELARYCDRGAELLGEEELRWGSTRPDRPSVFAQRYLPRVAALGEVARGARALADDFTGLLARHAFLRTAGPPRTPFGPTPAFLGRAAYREVYRALARARQPMGARVEGEEVRLGYRNLATLFEYWCFLKTIAHLSERFGRPQAWTSLALVDAHYRPDLKPGQEIRFPLPGARAVVATYEPEIHPWKAAQRRGDRLGASLTANPLRPDITIEVRGPGETATVLVLDAKSTDHFQMGVHGGGTDYARQVFEPQTMRQPVRQVFYLHRDRTLDPLVNLPYYLTGRPVPAEALISGAVPCIPEKVGAVPELLAVVIDRFLACCGQ